MKEKMKAVIKYEKQPGKTGLMEIDVPKCGEDQVLLKVMAAGVCGSDVDMWNQNIGYRIEVPVVHGHEFTGIIVETGSRVKNFKINDRVVCETAASICGQCYYCRTGQYNECPSRLGFGALIDGAFSEYIAVPERILHHIPDTLSFEKACLTEPCCVAYNGMVVKSKIQPGKPAVVIGPGTIGLLCVVMAKLAGAYPIITIGRNSSAKRLEMAKELGSDMVINTTFEDARKLIDKLTSGIGIPLVCDCAGTKETFHLSMDIVARNGQITKLGWGPEPINVSIDEIIQKAASIQGSFSHTWDTWETVIKLIDAGRINLGPFSTHIYSIEEFEKAFRAMDSRETVKSIIIPNAE